MNTDVRKNIFSVLVTSEVSAHDVILSISTHGKNFPFGFFGVDDRWETYPSALTDTILCLPVCSDMI